MARYLSRRGMSLLEVVFAASLFALVAMTVLNLLPSSSLAMTQTRQRVLADDIATATLEEARARPFAEFPRSQEMLRDPVTRDGLEYQVSLRSYVVDGENPDFLRGLRATVTWTYRDVRREVSQDTWIANIQR